MWQQSLSCKHSMERPSTRAVQIPPTAPASTSRPEAQFWGRSRFEATFFDVRAFKSYAASYRQSPPQRIFDTHNRQKRRLYEERIREVEGASFTPLVFASTGTTGRTSEAFLKRLASLLSDKRNTSYSETMGWLRCRVSFALLRANVFSLRGTRARDRSMEAHFPAVALSEARVQCWSVCRKNKKTYQDTSKLHGNFVTNFYYQPFHAMHPFSHLLSCFHHC